jgi:hypothetical protein
MDSDPEWAAQVRGREAAVQAETDAALRKMKDELAADQAREDPGADV